MRTIVLLVLALGACKDDAPPEDGDSGNATATEGDADADTDADTDTLPTTPTDPAATLVESGARACANPNARAADWWVRRSSPTAPSTDTLLPYDPWVWGSGLVAADFDGDGWVDLFASNESTPKLYRNVDGELSDVTASALAGLDLSLSSGGAAADFDADGDPDLLVTRYQRPNVLLRNEGGTFVDISTAAGIPSEARRTMSAAWADYDGDDDLDLYLGNYGFIDESLQSEQFAPAEPDWLLVNRGDGTFEDRSSVIPVDVHDGYTYVASWIDLNDDGFPELYVVNDFGVAYSNRLLWNNGDGTLTPDNNAVGLDGEWTGMGLDIADLNGDDVPDLIQPVWAGLVLLESLETALGPLWVESQGSRDLGPNLAQDQKVAWGGNFGDLDNDGDEDLVMQYGYVVVGDGVQWPNPLHQPDGLYLQQDDGSYLEQSYLHGADDRGINRGAVLLDVNQDGFLDIVKRDLEGANIAYVSQCDDQAWLWVTPHRSWGMNRDAIGARVRVFDGDQHWTQWLQAGGMSLASSEPPTLHFGLGDRDRVDRVEVRWPDGRISVFHDVATRQFLDISQDPP